MRVELPQQGGQGEALRQGAPGQPWTTTGPPTTPGRPGGFQQGPNSKVQDPSSPGGGLAQVGLQTMWGEIQDQGGSAEAQGNCKECWNMPTLPERKKQA